MKIEVDVNKLEDICEMATNDCELLYKFVFGNECNRNKCWGECPFLNEDSTIEWLKEEEKNYKYKS
mgnify:FL=1